jgi:UDP-N-acetylglucosamine--N-acetylmuramyl-(pentapeptide) pyrophosphoryl-undecaprenol N-acetylglucosamine transferase
MKTLLVCERSGGHVFPALALGKRLQKQGEDVCFFVTSSFLKTHLEKEGFKVYGTCFPSRNLILEGFFRLIEAIFILLKLRPRRVIGFGGRDSLFLMVFSALFFLETAIYEPNMELGKANKILSFFVRKVLRGFEHDSKKFKTVGIPLRENIRKIDKKEARKILGFDEQPVVFCFGGSQGASFINKTFVEMVQNSGFDYQLIHLTGKREYFQISRLYNKINKRNLVKDFSHSMEVFYSASDLVICRAGASTLGELSYYQLPSILIPYPEGGGHQKKNALYFKERGAAVVFFENQFSLEEFKDTVESFLKDKNLRLKMKNNLEKIKLGVSFEEFCKNEKGF